MTTENSKATTLQPNNFENDPNCYNPNLHTKKNNISPVTISLGSSSDEYYQFMRIGKILLLNSMVGSYFAWATVHFFQNSQ